MKKSIINLVAIAMACFTTVSFAGDNACCRETPQKAKVYFTRDISPKGILKVYKAINSEITGKVAIKCHTGEPHGPNIIPPVWVKEVQEAIPNSTIVETNVLYDSPRQTTEGHRETLKTNGWTFSKVDIMDEDGTTYIPIKNGKQLKEISVGSHMLNYDSMFVLTHFKGHQMGGFGGSIKNIGIGCADGKIGKDQIHHASEGWPMYEPFLERMVESAKGTMDHFGKKIVFVNVLRNMSVDCDCAGTKAAEPKTRNVGIFGSTDIIAVDRASLVAVYKLPKAESKDLRERMETRKAIRQITYAKELGMGNYEYELIDLDK
jgi:uncharacterized Fe-S center protein